MTETHLIKQLSVITQALPESFQPAEVYYAMSNDALERGFIALIYPEISSYSDLKFHTDRIIKPLLPDFDVFLLLADELNAENPEAWHILHFATKINSESFPENI